MNGADFRLQDPAQRVWYFLICCAFSGRSFWLFSHMTNPIWEKIIGLSSSFSESKIMRRRRFISAHVTRCNLLFHKYKTFQRIILIVYIFSSFMSVESAIVQKLSNISQLSTALQNNERVNLYHYRKVQTSLHYYRRGGGREGREERQRENLRYD